VKWEKFHAISSDDWRRGLQSARLRRATFKQRHIEQTQKMNFNEDKVPMTVDEAVKLIVDGLTDAEKASIAQHDPATLHFSLGMYLRNNWSMWERDTPLSQDFQQRFKLYGHGDDISGMILKSVWATVRGDDVAATQQKEAEFYREHWQAQGLDPATGKPAANRGEEIRIILDQDGGKTYDQALKGTLQDHGDLSIITKDKGTAGGRPIVMLTFSVQTPDGTRQRVQTVTTLRNFLGAASILYGRYGQQ
jgi:hypothetical protein